MAKGLDLFEATFLGLANGSLNMKHDFNHWPTESLRKPRRVRLERAMGSARSWSQNSATCSVEWGAFVLLNSSHSSIFFVQKSFDDLVRLQSASRMSVEARIKGWSSQRHLRRRYLQPF